MKDKTLPIIWGLLAALCAGLGFIPEPAGFGKWVMVMLALLFFLPGSALLLRGIRREDRKAVLRIRRISLASLLLTLLLIIANIAAVYASNTAGQILNVLLNLVSVPMFCLYWRGIGLFLWACLFVSSFPRLWKK